MISDNSHRDIVPSVSRAVSILLARHVLGFGVTFTATVILARHFGPEVWGIYGIASVAQYTAQGIVERGTAGYLIQRRIPPGPVQLATALLVQLVLGGCAAVLIAGAAWPAATLFRTQDLPLLLCAAAASVWLYALRAVPLGMLERTLSYGRVGLIELLDVVSFNLIALAAVVFGLGVASLAIALAFRPVLGLMLAWRLAPIPLRTGWSGASVRELAAFAAPYTASSALTLLNGAAAPLFVGTIAGTRALGLLQLAYSIVQYPLGLNWVLGRVALPLYSRIGSDTRRVSEGVSNATSAFLTYVGTATLVVAATSPVWIPPLYGPGWDGMIPIMMVIAPPLALTTAFTFVTAALNAVEGPKNVMVVSAGFTVLYWGSAFFLVPLVGVLGLPLAFSFASATVIQYVVLFRQRFSMLAIRAALSDLVLTSLGLAATAFVSQAYGVGWPSALVAVVLLWPLHRLRHLRLRRRVQGLVTMVWRW